MNSPEKDQHLEPSDAKYVVEIKLRGSNVVKKHNLSLRKDNPAKRWQVDGGI